MKSNNKITEMVDVRKLDVHPDNPRQGDIGAIVVSIEENGWYGTLVAQRSTNRVLAGNHRLQAAIAADIKEVPVYWVDVDDAQAKKILLADNRTSDLASYDDFQLLEILQNLVAEDHGLIGTGFDNEDLDNLLKDLDNDGPSQFQQFGTDLETDHTCPKCGYEF